MTISNWLNWYTCQWDLFIDTFNNIKTKILLYSDEDNILLFTHFESISPTGTVDSGNLSLAHLPRQQSVLVVLARGNLAQVHQPIVRLVAVDVVYLPWKSPEDQRPRYMVHINLVPAVPDIDVQHFVAISIKAFYHLPLAVANLAHSGIVRVIFFDMFYHFFFVLHNH